MKQLDVQKINWGPNGSFTWVCEYLKLIALGNQRYEVVNEGLRETGEIIELSDEEILERFVPSPHIHKRGYKTQYLPLQAHCVPEEVMVVVGEETHRLEPGDAILRSPEGEFKIVRREDFSGRYLAVSHYRKEKPPAFPYADE